ncbi:hypothetical protein [Streptomyces sp. NPDC015125]|uniref:hypothetical protein n=1 Tax=Streptomyces sp. NPDC015125 TaxID=3364938 RepID=UPI0036FED66D
MDGATEAVRGERDRAAFAAGRGGTAQQWGGGATGAEAQPQPQPPSKSQRQQPHPARQEFRADVAFGDGSWIALKTGRIAQTETLKKVL